MVALSFATGALLQVKRPATVEHLMFDKPLQCFFNGRFALSIAATRLHQLLPLNARATAEAAGLSADGANGGEQIAGRGGFVAEVSEFNRKRCRIKIIGCGNDGHIFHDNRVGQNNRIRNFF